VWLEATGFWQLTRSIPVGPLGFREFHPAIQEFQPVRRECIYADLDF
jgi:hypothetical protein